MGFRADLYDVKVEYTTKFDEVVSVKAPSASAAHGIARDMVQKRGKVLSTTVVGIEPFSYDGFPDGDTQQAVDEKGVA